MDRRLRTIAAVCQIAVRMVQAVIADLEEAGYLRQRRSGRRNQYIVNLDHPLGHPAEAGLHVRDLVELDAETVS
ncbi:MAG: hypothetical protein WCD21_15785 [Streptomyces sp.]